jgi:hypothetical protein
MRTGRLVAGIVMGLFGTLAMIGHALAQVEAYQIDLKAGQIFDVCASGLIRCPAIGNVCDDQKVVIPVHIPGTGVGFRGVGPGTTLCAAGIGSGSGRIFRITVS